MTPPTRDEAREQVAQIIAAQRYHYGSVAYDRDADAALSVLWPEVERLRAELDHAHAVIARHVEPLRKPCRPEAGDCCDGDAHTWQPSAASMLPDCGPAGAPVGDQGSGRVEMRRKEDHG